MVFAESVLEDLEVLEVLVFAVGVEFDAGHGHVQEDGVVDLAEGGAGAALFDFGYVELEEAVEPGEQLLPVRVLLLACRPVWCLWRGRYTLIRPSCLIPCSLAPVVVAMLVAQWCGW